MITVLCCICQMFARVFKLRPPLDNCSFLLNFMTIFKFLWESFMCASFTVALDEPMEMKNAQLFYAATLIRQLTYRTYKNRQYIPRTLERIAANACQSTVIDKRGRHLCALQRQRHLSSRVRIL